MPAEQCLNLCFAQDEIANRVSADLGVALTAEEIWRQINASVSLFDRLRSVRPFPSLPL